jgi:hypothetical protein
VYLSSADYVFYRYTELDPDLPPIPRNLESLSIHPVTRSILALNAYKNCFERDLCLKNLCISAQLYSFVMPLVGMLTHLELRCRGISPSATLFELFLRDGVHLESLRIQEASLFQTPSVHFRRYSHSLPHLKQFAISLSHPSSPSDYDPDIFPAICDFLRNKPGLVTLGLIAPRNPVVHRHLGFDRRCWDLLPALNHLRALSITLMDLGDSEHCAELIPRSVTSLALLGSAHGIKLMSMVRTSLDSPLLTDCLIH